MPCNRSNSNGDEVMNEDLDAVLERVRVLKREKIWLAEQLQPVRQTRTPRRDP
eukprot:SAG11_NODE_11284_length_771_cov_0.995536_1_plen_52_part_10